MAIDSLGVLFPTGRIILIPSMISMVYPGYNTQWYVGFCQMAYHIFRNIVVIKSLPLIITDRTESSHTNRFFHLHCSNLLSIHHPIPRKLVGFLEHGFYDFPYIGKNNPN